MLHARIYKLSHCCLARNLATTAAVVWLSYVLPVPALLCARLGPQLMALDRQNLTGPYALNLGWSVHRAVAQRLQVAALQDTATSECR